MSCKKEKKDCGCKKPCNKDLLGCIHYHSTDCITGNGIIGNQPDGTSVTNILKNFWTYFQDNLAEEGVSITGAAVNGSGNLIITLSDGNTINAGYVKGADGTNGINGTNGIDGTNGTNGIDGLNGTNGADGLDGVDGVGVESIEINGDNIEITYTDGSTDTIGGATDLKGNYTVTSTPLNTAYSIDTPTGAWEEVITTGLDALGATPNAWRITYSASISTNSAVVFGISGYNAPLAMLTLGKIETSSLGREINLDILITRRGGTSPTTWDVRYNLHLRDSFNNLASTSMSPLSSGIVDSSMGLKQYSETGIGALGGGVTFYKDVTQGSVIDRIKMIEKLQN